MKEINKLSATGPYKKGSAAFIGEPNVGKSSLVNALVGESVSIVTEMAGTTRETPHGYVTGSGFKLTLIDTPGMHNKKMGKDALAKAMNKNISGAVREADVLCYVLDAGDIRDEYIQKIKNLLSQNSASGTNSPRSKPNLIVVVNKTDKSNYRKLYPQLDKLNGLGVAVVPTSCKTGMNLDVLIQEIVKLLPEAEQITDSGDDEIYTNQTIRKMCSEIIRGELIKRLHSEVPHGIAVEITVFRESAGEIEINAEIYCVKAGHKPIIIGKNGAVLKAAGIESRRQIEKLCGKHVKLKTHVLVREGWRDKLIK